MKKKLIIILLVVVAGGGFAAKTFLLPKPAVAVVHGPAAGVAVVFSVRDPCPAFSLSGWRAALSGLTA